MYDLWFEKFRQDRQKEFVERKESYCNFRERDEAQSHFAEQGNYSN